MKRLMRPGAGGLHTLGLGVASALVTGTLGLMVNGPQLTASYPIGPAMTSSPAAPAHAAPSRAVPAGAKPAVTLMGPQVSAAIAHVRATESAAARSAAAETRSRLASGFSAVYRQAQLAGALAGASPQGRFLQAQVEALPNEAEARMLLARIPDDKFSAHARQQASVTTKAAAQLAYLHSLVAAAVVVKRGAHPGTAGSSRPHAQSYPGELLGVQPATQPADSDTPDCPDYPGGGQTPDDNARAIDGLRALDGTTLVAEFVYDITPSLLSVPITIVTDETVPNPEKALADDAYTALQIATDVYDGFITRAADCQNDGVNVVLRDTRRDLDHLTSSIGTVLELDQAVAGLLDGRTQEIAQLLAGAQSALDAEEVATKTAVDKVTATTGVAQAAVDAQARRAIEADLAGTGPVVVADALPAAAGGYLDAPDGVRDTVHALQATLDAAHVSYDPAALRELSAGDAALAARQYVSALADYRLAYGDLVS